MRPVAAKRSFHYLYKNRFVLAIGILGRGGDRLRKMLSGPESLAIPPNDNGSDGDQPDDSIRAALLVGYRRNGTKLELREIRYFTGSSEAGRHVDL